MPQRRRGAGECEEDKTKRGLKRARRFSSFQEHKLLAWRRGFGVKEGAERERYLEKVVPRLSGVEAQMEVTPVVGSATCPSFRPYAFGHAHETNTRLSNPRRARITDKTAHRPSSAILRSTYVSQ